MTPLRITSASRCEETTLRLGGDGYSYAMTWTSDDRQLVAVCDGCGWPENPTDRYYSSRLFTAGGEPRTARFEEMMEYPPVPLWEAATGHEQGIVASYYGLNILAVGGRVYQYLSTVNRVTDEGWISGLKLWNGAKLIFSPDNGRTWRNHDGSSPVILERPVDQSRETTTFLKEPQDAFSVLSFLQMGKDYRDNRDGYVYVYSPNGSIDGTMNELVMFRVPKAQVLQRAAYEYFAGLRADGEASWTKDIDSRAIVHTFPRGWVHTPVTMSWVPSVVYNAPLGVYMMVNCGWSIDLYCTSSGKPSYMGLWISRKPWGPWTQIHEEVAWLPAGDPSALAVAPQISPKWIAVDGKSFWLAWTDAQYTSSGIGKTFDEPLNYPNVERGERWFKRERLLWRQYHPYFAFNTQRVDLIVT